jgi:hypothetical protein
MKAASWLAVPVSEKVTRSWLFAAVRWRSLFHFSMTAPRPATANIEVWVSPANTFLVNPPCKVGPRAIHSFLPALSLQQKHFCVSGQVNYLLPFSGKISFAKEMYLDTQTHHKSIFYILKVNLWNGDFWNRISDSCKLTPPLQLPLNPVLLIIFLCVFNLF